MKNPALYIQRSIQDLRLLQATRLLGIPFTQPFLDILLRYFTFLFSPINTPMDFFNDI